MLLVAVCLVATGCGRQKSRVVRVAPETPNTTQETKAPDFPPTIQLLLDIKDYKVQQIRPQSTLGSIRQLRFDDEKVYRTVHGVVVRFMPVADRFCSCYYQILVREQATGSQNVVAKKLEYRPPVGAAPSEEIPLQVVIENLRVARDFRWLESRSEYQGLYMEGYYDEGGQRIAILKSPHFTDVQWVFPLPDEDGVWNILALRVPAR